MCRKLYQLYVLRSGIGADAKPLNATGKIREAF